MALVAFTILTTVHKKYTLKNSKLIRIISCRILVITYIGLFSPISFPFTATFFHVWSVWLFLNLFFHRACLVFPLRAPAWILWDRPIITFSRDRALNLILVQVFSYQQCLFMQIFYSLSTLHELFLNKDKAIIFSISFFYHCWIYFLQLEQEKLLKKLPIFNVIFLLLTLWGPLWNC